jgi:acyl carrier protein
MNRPPISERHTSAFRGVLADSTGPPASGSRNKNGGQVVVTAHGVAEPRVETESVASYPRKALRMDVRQEIEEYIKDNILFGDGEKVAEDVSFQESGILDSVGFLELITFVEARFGIQITDNELVPENFDTLRKVSRFVEQKLDAGAPA